LLTPPFCRKKERKRIELININDQIFLSCEFGDDAVRGIKEEGFDAVIDLRAEAFDNESLIRECGMEFFHASIVDHGNPTLDCLESIFGFVDPFLDAGKKILIHCKNGTGRAPLVAIAVLAHRSAALSAAVALVEAQHPDIGFSEVQKRFIEHKLARFLRSGR